VRSGCIEMEYWNVNMVVIREVGTRFVDYIARFLVL